MTFRSNLLESHGKITLIAKDTRITWSTSDTVYDLPVMAWSDSNLLGFNVNKTVALSYRGD